MNNKKHLQVVDFSNPNADKITSGSTKAMTNNKQQTAVDFYREHIHALSIDGKTHFTTTKQVYEEAKEMEKEQIKNAHNEGYGSGYMDDSKSPEQYYNETYVDNK
jgi:hypothetical protein